MFIEQGQFCQAVVLVAPVEHLDTRGAAERQDQGQVVVFQCIAVQVQFAVARLLLAEVFEQCRDACQCSVTDLSRRQFEQVVLLPDLQQVAVVLRPREVGEGVAKQFLNPLGNRRGAVATEAAYPQVGRVAVGRQAVEKVAQAVEQCMGTVVATDQ